ncbi:MAG TPA: hypothetical protein DDY86_10335 [Syntrophaceae bacterium]|nr:hypothetical protein [Syntrophaceae bacterium]
MFFRHRQQRRLTLAAAAWILSSLLAAATAAAPEEDAARPRKIAVITHLENETASLTRSELARMFKKTQTEWPDGRRCIPIDQLGGSAIRAEFSRIVLRESLDDIKRYWMQQTMTGNARPPISLESSATVKKYLQKLPGAVAYIYLDEVDETVQVLSIVDTSELAAPPAETPEDVEVTPADTTAPPAPPPPDDTPEAEE